MHRIGTQSTDFHRSGALSPVSPRIRDRSGDVMPSWNSEGKVHSTRGQSARAQPAAVIPTLIADCGFTFADARSTGHRLEVVIEADMRESQRRAPARSVILTKSCAACGRCR